MAPAKPKANTTNTANSKEFNYKFNGNADTQKTKRLRSNSQLENSDLSDSSSDNTEIKEMLKTIAEQLNNKIENSTKEIKESIAEINDNVKLHKQEIDSIKSQLS